MFVSSFNVAVSVFVSVPLCMILPAILIWIFAGFWWGLGYACLFPVMFILSWNYMKMYRKFLGTWNFVRKKNRKTVKGLRELRKSIFKRLDDML
jgi:uncharacterized membrane protein YgcG